jgi:glycerol-3-phosphate acyltransferase PlsY
MSTITRFLLGGTGSYLLGAIPFGYLVARLKGVDIRAVGSGNIGATNVFRCVGKPWGLLTLLCDALKGFAAAFVLSRCAFGPAHPARPWATVAFGCLAVAGHNWPVTLRFRGGKGVATSAGALVGIAPPAAAVGLAVWLGVLLLTRYVSVASMASAAAIAAVSWIAFASGRIDSPLVPAALALLAAAVIWRHKTNIRRLQQGSENRFRFGKGRGAPPGDPPHPAAGGDGT